MNVILLTIDCLRADHVGCLGYRRPTTPKIDDLAKRYGIVFSQAMANGPNTLASFPSILASVYPLIHGGACRLSEKQTTIAEVLREAGYLTVAYHSNPYLSKPFGYDRGFDVFDDTFKDMSKVALAARKARRLIPRNSFLYNLLRKVNRFMNVKSLAPPFVKADVITEKGLGWLSRADGRLFLWLHYMDAHYPYVPPQEFAQRFCERLPKSRNLANLFGTMLEDPDLVLREEIDLLVALYDAQISHVDACVGQIIDAVWERGLHEDTIIVITADHGEEFREHGDFSHATSLHSRRSAKLYDELLHVPLIFYVPPRVDIEPPVTVDELVSLMDLAPTIVDILGIEKPDGWLGESLLPLILGDEQERTGGVISEYEYKLQPEGRRIVHASCRTERWKFIFDGRGGAHKLFDLQKDPRELENLYESEREMAAELEAKVREHLWRVSMTGEALEEADVGEEVMDRLRGLGYLS